MIGKTVAHYKIVEKLGEGGMGVVYKAEDTKLKRTVALKFLPSELTRDAQAKARFVQEAQAAAALDHPNICAVYEIGEAEGATYIAMPYVKGQGLRERIAAGPLSIDEALAVANQVAEGLKEAHEKGIIHRDIKPANIMLTEKGQAKIMDFGLAKFTSGPDVTKTLTVMGTIAYMSPEQARGEAVDHRTDIWSFGAMLYEMVTGQTPFAKRKDEAMLGPAFPDMPALLHSILYDPVEPPSRLRKDLPRQVELIILKALDKDRFRRYQSMDEVMKDLKAARAPEFIFPKPEKSIIVLPFEDMSPSKDNEYFSDGMTEEIIADLSHVHDLLVISRSSAMTFKGTKKKIKEIAQEVNVRYVLEGSVRKAGNNLRITAQLIDGLNDAHLWAEKYSGTLDDVFDIQEKVSRSIVEALKLKLTPQEKQEIAGRPIANVAAYEYYLRAKAEIFKFSVEAEHRAIRYLQDALNIVGDNALLYTGIALAYFGLSDAGYEWEDSLEKAEAYVNKALALDPNLGQAHAVYGWLFFLKGNLREIVYHSKKALILCPDEPLALQGLAGSLVYFAGKISEAAPLVDRLLTIDPLDFMTGWILGASHYYAGKFDLALADWQRVYELYPDNPTMHFWYPIALASCGQKERAISVIDQTTPSIGDTLATKYGLFLKYGLQGDSEKIAKGLSPDIRRRSLAEGQSSYFIALCFAMAQKKEETLDWLENAINRGVINYPFLAEYEPFLASIRGEPRFQKLMERVKYEWEHFEV